MKISTFFKYTIIVLITTIITTYVSYGLIVVTNSHDKTNESVTLPTPTPKSLVIQTSNEVIEKKGIKRIEKKDSGQLKLEIVWRGPINKRKVALTIDDGPSPKTTKKILQIL
ncbi:MAG TPA: hypothetical protein EYP16_02630, partial [Candidatus Atribacteria bacterium]|nr:hypothetical protein [Candidatus Atribacteria bacterium]